MNKSEINSRRIMSAGSIDIVEYVTCKTVGGKIKFPVKRLNEVCDSVCPGYTIAILGIPGSGKSTFALNLAFLNSILDNKRTLYLYMEDMPERYHCNILSRYSYHVGDKLESKILKKGISPSNIEVIKKIQSIQERFREKKKGEIFYIGMAQLSAEPDIFAKDLTKIVKELKIDIIIIDYIQRVKSFKPASYYSVMDFQNQITSVLSNVALGQYGSPPCINIMLSQLNREAQKKAIKTGGDMFMFDVAEISSIERDSMLMIGVHSDQLLRDCGEIGIKILKNRDDAADSSSIPTKFEPMYCMVGDVDDDHNVLNNEELETEWNYYEGLLG